MQQISNSYEIDVVGRIWQGCRATYTYKQVGGDVTDSVVHALAGDFANVEDWRATQIESSVEYKSPTETIFTTRYILVHDWSNCKSQRFFEKCNAA